LVAREELFQSRPIGVGNATPGGINRTSMASPICRFVAFEIRRRMAGTDAVCLSASFAIGVGHNPYPIPMMLGTNGRCRDAMPFRIEPERGQVSKNSSEPPRKEPWSVLHDNDTGSNFANETGALGPKARAFASKARALSGETDILARETGADGIDGNSICAEPTARERFRIVIAGHPRPVFREHGAAMRVDLAERDRAEGAGPLQAERKPPDAGEQVEQAKRFGHDAIHFAMSTARLA
jgi:hypothetical protein